MSLVAFPLPPSSSCDEFAALLDAELDAISYAFEGEDHYGDAANDSDLRLERYTKLMKPHIYFLSRDVGLSIGAYICFGMIHVSRPQIIVIAVADGRQLKRHKLDIPEEITTGQMSLCDLQAKQTLDYHVMGRISANILVFLLECVGSVGKTWMLTMDLRLSVTEIARRREEELKELVRRRKLYLVLDLDHTLLNSVCLPEVTVGEEYLNVERDALPGFHSDSLRGSLHRLDWLNMLTKLRPFVHSFLKEASNLFEMYIYTMGERSYALEMAKLLDPDNVYFNDKVISQGDCTTKHQKSLDVLLGQESAVLILDDTETVWKNDKHNLILMERYHFFAASCKPFNSLSQLKVDESESKGALAAILKVLQRIHTSFFHNLESHQNKADVLVRQDVRQVLRTLRGGVLEGCKLVFSGFSKDDRNHLWKLVERLGAKCCIDIDPSVTHVVSMNATTQESRWAIGEGNNKFLVNRRWIEASNYLWEKQPEENFVVMPARERTG
ncbi:hypothetical protein OROHE_009173 [Orobanche hederae]